MSIKIISLLFLRLKDYNNLLKKKGKIEMEIQTVIGIKRIIISYGGRAEIDWDQRDINIDISKERKKECIEEIERFFLEQG